MRKDNLNRIKEILVGMGIDYDNNSLLLFITAFKNKFKEMHFNLNKENKFKRKLENYDFLYP